jgi:hypothetical protein
MIEPRSASGKRVRGWRSPSTPWLAVECVNETGILGISPPRRRGGRADLIDDSLPSEIGAAGEVQPLLHQWSDAPAPILR